MFAKYNKVLGASVESQNATSVVHLLGVIVWKTQTDIIVLGHTKIRYFGFYHGKTIFKSVIVYQRCAS